VLITGEVSVLLVSVSVQIRVTSQITVSHSNTVQAVVQKALLKAVFLAKLSSFVSISVC
tara:strand:- start:3541 stop:3717 length:177 start_codon:yes stop_codon:yes gene_type:complete